MKRLLIVCASVWTVTSIGMEKSSLSLLERSKQAADIVINSVRADLAKDQIFLMVAACMQEHEGDRDWIANQDRPALAQVREHRQQAVQQLVALGFKNYGDPLAAVLQEKVALGLEGLNLASRAAKIRADLKSKPEKRRSSSQPNITLAKAASAKNNAASSSATLPALPPQQQTYPSDLSEFDVQKFDIPLYISTNFEMKSTVDELNFLQQITEARAKLAEEIKAAEEANKKQQEEAAKPDAKRAFLEKMIAEAPTSELKFMLQNQLAMHNLTHHQQQTKLTKSSSTVAAIQQKEKQLDDEMSKVAKSVINKADDRNAKLQQIESCKKQFEQELCVITEQEKLLNDRRGQLEGLLSQLTEKEAKLQASLSTVNEAKKLVVKDIFNTAGKDAFNNPSLD